MKPDDSLPLIVEDLTACSVCALPATGWRHGAGGTAVGCCGSAPCATEIAARHAANPGIPGCRVCSAPSVRWIGMYPLCDRSECEAVIFRAWSGKGGIA